MIRIRKGIFETNSSSNDCYYDDDDKLYGIQSNINFSFNIKLNNYNNDIKKQFENNQYLEELETILIDFFKNLDIIKDTYIELYSYSGGKIVEIYNYDEDEEDELWYDFNIKIYCDAEMISPGYYSGATRYEPEHSEPMEYEIYVPEWDDKHNIDLTQAIKKSSLGQYINKIYKVYIDLGDVEYEIEKIRDYYKYCAVIDIIKPSDN